MNNLAVVIGALVNAAEADNAYAVTSQTIKIIREALPKGCTGYSLTEVRNIARLKEVINATVNTSKQKYFATKIIESNDLRYDDSVLVYCTTTMAKKWKSGDEAVPDTLTPYLTSNAENNEEGLAS